MPPPHGSVYVLKRQRVNISLTKLVYFKVSTALTMLLASWVLESFFLTRICTLSSNPSWLMRAVHSTSNHPIVLIWRHTTNRVSIRNIVHMLSEPDVRVYVVVRWLRRENFGSSAKKLLFWL